MKAKDSIFVNTMFNIQELEQSTYNFWCSDHNESDITDLLTGQ